jgi:hypothetical protein
METLIDLILYFVIYLSPLYIGKILKLIDKK